MSSGSMIPQRVGSRSRGDTTTAATRTLLLQEARGLPVFWSGTEAVSKFAWKVPSTDSKLDKMSISEVLEKFSSQDYIRCCNVSLAVSSDNSRAFSLLRMSDNFSTLWSSTNKQNTVKLILDASTKGDVFNEPSTKYILILTEMSKKRIFWDGRRPVFSMIGRVTEAQMLTTVETTLRKYLPLDYLRNQKVKLQLLISKTEDGNTRPVDLGDTLGSIFSGSSASLRISIVPQEVMVPAAFAENETVLETNQLSDQSIEEMSNSLSLENFWFQSNWAEVREKVRYLMDALVLLRKERELSQSYNEKLSTEKQLLETAMRRRNRNMDEIWGCYELLKSDVDSAIHLFPYKSNLTPSAVEINRFMGPSSTPAEPAPPSDSTNVLAIPRANLEQTTTSCIDVVAHAFRGMGIEILDEDQRISPAAGIAFTMAVVVAVCVISHIVAR